MIPHDYHMHSNFSVDCRVPLAERCEQAIALGLREICVTDHADFIPKDSGVDYYQPEAYFAELQRCRALYDGRVTLRAGVEIGEWHRFPERATALADGFPYDFIMGSLHWVGDELVLEQDYFEGKTEAQAYEAYFAELLTMVRFGGFDVIGHLDVPKRAGFPYYGSFTSSDWEEPIRAVLRAAIERGIGIEVNTGTARRTVAQPSPDLTVLRWYRELGGEIITIGSDSHRLTDMAFQFDRAEQMLRETGFTAITCFEGRKPVFVDVGNG